MTVRTWTCQRRSQGVKCGTVNPRRFQLCQACGKRRPATRKPAHLVVLDEPYEAWVERFGERCGICGKGPSVKRPRLDRDHEHKGTGRARGLLCAICNLRLKGWMDPVWLRAAAAYLERADEAA
jgi:hypothetical protein